MSQYDPRVLCSELVYANRFLMLPGIFDTILLISDPHIPKKGRSLAIMLKNLYKIFCYFFHGLMIWGNTCPNEAVGVRVSIKNVYSAVLDTV